MEKEIREFHLINAAPWGGFIVVDGVEYEKTYSNIIDEGERIAFIVLEEPDCFSDKIVKTAKKLVSSECKRKKHMIENKDYSEEVNLRKLEKACILSHKLVTLLEKDLNFSNF